jgi:hypothetical protein
MTERVGPADSARGAVARVDGGRRQVAATIAGIGPNPRAIAIVVWVSGFDSGEVTRLPR